jgi:mono/diheme cytochrome c family protein
MVLSSKIAIGSVWACALLTASAVVVSGQQPPAAAPGLKMVERGKYLVTVHDCQGCHTPSDGNGNPDQTRRLSGHPQSIKITSAPNLQNDGVWTTAISRTNTAWAGPWGVTFTPNLTPDKLTGIGLWSEGMFVNTIKNGRHAGSGRAIQPPMPWKTFATLSDDDLKAIYAYLRTVQPIVNKVPPPILSRSALGDTHYDGAPPRP